MRVERPSLRRSLSSGLLVFAIAGTVSAEQDAGSFFADVRRSYAERSSYSDVGQIEITEEIDGVESSRLHFFETTMTRATGLEWRVLMDSDRGFEERVVWLAGDSVRVYDGGLRQAKPVLSIAAGIAEVLGPGVGQALVVPTLLERGVGSAALDALATNSTLGEPEPCFDDRQCRLLSAPLSAGGTIRLTVETETFWIREVEVVLPGADPASSIVANPAEVAREPKTTTVRVSHSLGTFDRHLETRVAFSPPAATLEVREWERPETGFFDEITVNIFTAVARIVTHAGYPLANLEPEDLIATVGGEELPVTAVDWYGATVEPDEGRDTAGPQTELPEAPAGGALAESESGPAPDGRLIVIFLQNDFVPLRVPGLMRLYPGLRRLVDNLGVSDRVAVLSFFGHLKLWQDFTTDREAVKASLERAFYPGARPDRVAPSRGLSLVDYFDQDAARKVSNSVAALHFTADALAPIPGQKEVIFFGFGLEGGRTVPMLRALQAARATTFVIGTCCLHIGLRELAEATGGTYDSSFPFWNQALHRLERTMTGHYVITIDRSAIPELRGRLRIRLRERKGKVLMVPSELG